MELLDRDTRDTFGIHPRLHSWNPWGYRHDPQLYFWCRNPLPCAFLCVADKPLPQSAPGGIIGIVGGVIAAVFIIGVAVTVTIVYRRQQKSRSGTDNDL